MEHLFLTSDVLKDKTLEELQEGITQIMNRLSFAHRIQHGPMIHQLHMILESYRAQYNKKMDEVLAKQKLNKHIHVEKRNK
jgi:hypothetical protein